MRLWWPLANIPGLYFRSKSRTLGLFFGGGQATEEKGTKAIRHLCYPTNTLCFASGGSYSAE